MLSENSILRRLPPGLEARQVVLLDGTQIANLMIDFGVGVTPVATYVVKRLDSDYFDEA